LFADEDIEKGQFIGEYVGEYITTKREDREYAVAQHLKRTYGFQATAGWSINAANIGNEMRFMNHKPTGKFNVQTKYLLVHGDTRIAFIAASRIAKGAELFINYGHTFWKESKDGWPNGSVSIEHRYNRQ